MIKKLLIATKNQDKIAEIRLLLADLDVELLTLNEFPNVPDVIEDGLTLAENAIKKAKSYFEFTKIPAVADDTGLEVDYLNELPGVYSARFAGENATYSDNVNKLLKELHGIPSEKRGATFRCVVALCNEQKTKTVEGKCEGVILEETRGESGFGYDPVFYVPEYDCTFAEMDLELKNRVSHRAKAFLKLKELLSPN